MKRTNSSHCSSDKVSSARGQSVQSSSSRELQARLQRQRQLLKLLLLLKLSYLLIVMQHLLLL